MSGNKNLDSYFLRLFDFRLVVVALLAILTIYFATTIGEDGTKPEKLVGLVLDSREGRHGMYLTVELKSGKEIDVRLPSHQPVRIGANARVLKMEADPLTGLSWKFEFDRYVD